MFTPHLYAGLGMDSLQRVSSYTVQTLRQSLDGLCEFRTGAYPDAVQGASLPGGQARNQGQVILRTPLGATLIAPATNAAVFDRLGSRGQRMDRRLIQYGFELASHLSVIGGVVGDAKGNRLAFRTPEGEVHLRRCQPLILLKQIGIHAQLEYGRGLGVAGKLSIPDLIAPGAKIAGLFHASQEVGKAQSPAVE